MEIMFSIHYTMCFLRRKYSGATSYNQSGSTMHTSRM